MRRAGRGLGSLHENALCIGRCGQCGFYTFRCHYFAIFGLEDVDLQAERFGDFRPAFAELPR